MTGCGSVFRRGGVFFNLLAQTVDVNGDGYVVAHALKPPDHFVQIHADGSAEEELLRHERRQRLSSAVAALLPEERNLFYRKYYYCQPTVQMAAELGLTERAVEGRLYRLRQKLRQQLGGDFCE